jgi:uncharacterized protein
MQEIYLQLRQTKEDLKEKITNKEVSVYMIDNTPPTRKAICDGGVTNFHIYLNGNIYPCSYTVGYKDYCVGDINKGIDVKKIKKLEEINKKDIRECHGCNYKSYCSANICKLINKAITGEVCIPSPAICNFEGIALRLFQDNS